MRYITVSVSGYSASHDQAARNFVTMVRLFRMARMGADTDTEDLPGEDWRSKAEAKGETHTEDPLAIALERARERGRGREAVAPEAIPPLGWRDILWRVLKGILEDRILYTSGGVAFFTLLSFFPAVATIVSVYGLVADVSTIHEHLTLLVSILPDGAITLIGNQMAHIANQAGTLSLVFFIIALWSADSGVAALFDAFNVIYKEKERRSLLALYGMTFLFTLAGMAFLLVAIGAVIVLPLVLAFLGMSTPAERFLSIVRWPILLMVLIPWLAALYRYGPSRRSAKWRWVTWGSAVAAVLWILTSIVFSWYVASFESYNRLYGSLGAGVGFMVPTRTHTRKKESSAIIPRRRKRFSYLINTDQVFGTHTQQVLFVPDCRSARRERRRDRRTSCARPEVMQAFISTEFSPGWRPIP
jgi:membrane protein